MREIKFRGKRLDNGEWIYGYYGHKEASDQHFIMVETMNSHHDWTYFTDYEVDPKTVGQSSGLKDKNGTEIYEGDIVTRGDGNFKVIYKQDRHYIGWVATDRNEASYIHIWYDGLEIIGNIYENPELLKGEESE